MTRRSHTRNLRLAAIALLVGLLAVPSRLSAACVAKGEDEGTRGAADKLCEAFPWADHVWVRKGVNPSRGPAVDMSIPPAELARLLKEDKTVCDFIKDLLKALELAPDSAFYLMTTPTGVKKGGVHAQRFSKGAHVTGIYRDTMALFDLAKDKLTY